MKKVLSIILTVCLILTAAPLCVSSVADTGIAISTNVERLLYNPGDTVRVNIDLTNNEDGIAAFRGKLYYDSANLTFKEVFSDSPIDVTNSSEKDLTKPDQLGYVQILWDTEGLVNYYESGTIATVCFTVNENAANQDYDFTFEYMDGALFINEETWEYVTDVTTSGDTMTVNTEIPSKLYFENIPTGAYLGETVTLDIAFSSSEGLYAFASKLHYDADNYEFESCVSNNADLGLEYNNKDGYVNLLWDSTATANYTDTAVIASITFTVNETATVGTSRFELEYVDAVSIDLTSDVPVETAYFNAFSCEFPLLAEKVPVTFTLNRGNEATETVELYAGETLVLPDTNFVDKTWYTDPSASVESIYNETICPEEGVTLYSGACAVDYTGSDLIVPYRYSQNYSIVEDNGAETLHYAPGEASETANMFRLSKVKDNVTYKLTVKYKAAVESSLGFGVVGGTGNNMYVNTSYFEGDADTALYNISENTDGYKTADIFFTASLKGTVTEQSASDDAKTVNGNGWSFLTVINADNGNNEIWISELTLTEIGEVILPGGASILTDSAYTAAEETQALRYYFSYNTVKDENDNLNIVIGDKNFKIVARGFLYRNGAVNKYVNDDSVTKEGMNYTAANNSSDIISQIKTTDFNNCWSYSLESGELCFSTYINGYTEAMFDYKLMVRGFVTFQDEAGNEFTVYSTTINRSVNGMKNNPESGVDVL